MFTKDEIKKLQQQIDELSADIKMIAERQNSQYTSIVLQLNEIEDEIRSNTENLPESLSVEEQYSIARTAVISTGKASTSFIQRKLNIGYSRASLIMDMLEKRGVIGLAQGSKPREILIHDSNIPPILTDDNESDELYESVESLVRSTGHMSTSIIQKKCGCGYSRAVKLMDMLEEKGVIGPANGDKPREILV